MRPITDVLAEFPYAGTRALFAPFAIRPPVPGPMPDPVPTGPDPAEHELALDAARCAGVAEGHAAAEAAGAEDRAALVASHAEDLAAARAAWAAQEGEVLADGLKAGLAAIEGAIAGRLSEILVPFLTAAARTRAAEAMRAAVADLLAGSPGALIEVRGPGDLLEPVRSAFAENAAVVVTETEETELSARAGDTVIASQVAAWTERLAAAMGDAP